MIESFFDPRRGIASRVNLWGIEDKGLIWGTAGQAAFAYDIAPGVDLLLESGGGMNDYIRQAQSMLGMLPEGASLTCLIEAGETPKHHHADASRKKALETDGPFKALLEARATMLQSARLMQRRQSLFLGIEHPLAAGKMSAKIFLPSKECAVQEKIQGVKDRLIALESNLFGQIGPLKTQAKRLDRNEVLGLYWRLLNPSRAKQEGQPISYLEQTSLRSQLCASAAQSKKSHFWIDGKYFSAVSMFSFGEEMELGSMDKFIRRLPPESCLLINFLAIDCERALQQLKKSQRLSFSLVSLGGVKNYEAQIKSGELDEIITLIRDRGERLLLTSLFTLASGVDEDALASSLSRITMAFRDCLGCEAVVEDLLHERMFFSRLPLSVHHCPRKRLVTTEIAAYLAPFSSTWRHQEPCGAIFETAEQEIFSFGPFVEDSPRHGLVIGSTGSGKSFSMNYLIMSLLAGDPAMRFVVIDIGGSYKRLCHYLGGDYFEVCLSEQFAINPFPAKEVMLAADGSFDSDLLGYLRILIQKMLLRPVTQIEKRLLEAALRRLYGESVQDTPMLGEFVKTLEELGGQSDDCQEALRLARELKLYSEGIYGKILNSPSQIKPFSGRLTVFDLAHLKDHRELQVPLIFMISFGLTQTLKDKAIKKVIVIDEGWEFFNDETASDLVSRLYRTARKFNAAIISVSQSPQDFLTSQASTAMIANAEWKIFLRLAMGHEALEAFGLNPAQIEATKGLSIKQHEYAEMLLTFGDRSRVLRLRPTELEYRMATSNAQESAVIEACQEEARVGVLAGSV